MNAWRAKLQRYLDVNDERIREWRLSCHLVRRKPSVYRLSRTASKWGYYLTEPAKRVDGDSITLIKYGPTDYISFTRSNPC